MLASRANSSWAKPFWRRSARTTDPNAFAAFGSNDVARLAALVGPEGV